MHVALGKWGTVASYRPFCLCEVAVADVFHRQLPWAKDLGT